MSEPEALPEVRAVLQRLEPGERAIESEYPDNIGKRTKLGGKPDWIQGEDIPQCFSCEEPMTFVAQIDSIDYDGWGTVNDYMFGDVGMIYVFYCFGCNETESVHQGY